MTEVLVSSVNRKVPEMTPETDIGRQSKASHSNSSVKAVSST